MGLFDHDYAAARAVDAERLEDLDLRYDLEDGWAVDARPGRQEAA
jgi:hypothetical protein